MAQTLVKEISVFEIEYSMRAVSHTLHTNPTFASGNDFLLDRATGKLEISSGKNSPKGTISMSRDVASSKNCANKLAQSNTFVG